MRRILSSLFLLFALIMPSFTAEYKSASGLFNIDFETGWKEAKSNDTTVVMRLENGKMFLEFSKLEDELTDYYLKAKLKEQIESLRRKGTSISDDIKQVGIHSVSTAYYSVYTGKYGVNIISFFTYQGVSYGFISEGVGENEFRDLMYFFRKPGEKIEVKKPKPAPKRKHRAEKVSPEPKDELTASATTENFPPLVTEEPEVSSVPVAVSPVTAPSASAQMAEARADAGKFISEMVKKGSESSSSPLIKRYPFHRYLAASAVFFWFVLSLMFGARYSSIPNPKMNPYPKDIPPDFFFPFIITRVDTSGETMYQVITRQKQILSAYYNHGYRPVLHSGIYGLLFFHLIWSFSCFINADFMTGIFMSLPFGRYVASLPEAPFLILILWGLWKKIAEKNKLAIHDRQANLVMAVFPGKNFYAVLKDGKGKDVAQLHQRGTAMERKWHFTDVDNQIAFTIIDEHPGIYLASKFFGAMGGKLRCRYGIFVDNKRAGFLFVDPHSPSGFQIHLEFDYARLAHPAQILAALLYIISKDRERLFLSL